MKLLLQQDQTTGYLSLTSILEGKKYLVLAYGAIMTPSFVRMSTAKSLKM